MTTVVDTNVVAALMLPTAANAEVAELLRQVSDWRLPPLWRSEFRQVLLKYVRADLATPEQALALWHKALERFELSEQPVAGHQVLALAIATGCSTYDAEFVVLARQLNCRLLTRLCRNLVASNSRVGNLRRFFV